MAKTRKLRKSQLLFSKVGKCKQITKMFITPVLTMLTQTFWALFAALGCPHKIKKNLVAIFSVDWEIGKRRFEEPFLSFLCSKLRKLILPKVIIFSSSAKYIISFWLRNQNWGCPLLRVKFCLVTWFSPSVLVSQTKTYNILCRGWENNNFW